MDDQELQDLIDGVKRYPCPECGTMARAAVDVLRKLRGQTIRLTCVPCGRQFEVRLREPPG
jgi:transcription elongation factor Elf1